MSVSLVYKQIGLVILFVSFFLCNLIVHEIVEISNDICSVINIIIMSTAR